MLKVINTF